jgi:hypothetical protein
MGDIILNCLIIPSEQFISLTRDETTVTVNISTFWSGFMYFYLCNNCHLTEHQ